jgi:myo-inositol 2-dehydrogenase/D-chiro-inositol 1-dehydrogenase
LATSRETCDRIVDADVATGRRLVSVGSMRRYDAQYRALKAVTSGEIGAPLIMHAAHRNPSVPGHYTPAT